MARATAVTRGRTLIDAAPKAGEDVAVDRDALGLFLRHRREQLHPSDVGMVAGGRRRAPGLRRDEVAVLADMSSDYYERIEQGRGPRPSRAMLVMFRPQPGTGTAERLEMLRVIGTQNLTV